MIHHCERGRATLAAVQMTPDGGAIYQSWQICGCVLAGLHETLGAPRHEAVATAEQVDATGHAVMAAGGGIHLERPE
ncbi:hypothetical protein C1I98_13370 [Spongiactinospora gelatinilytica]|uniref:Uncharacterized protein n=1 Tax=Spongiactinospora gelatinilytica TaxID=2666298 RepID=A0A2W2H657_9ACTN|nr:hypothetical protein [Spongiactinospora gelatinilytica]PZG47455.1 hypothetical protein C1I98_13370 [Spongiactinospora gelatinilytica]